MTRNSNRWIGFALVVLGNVGYALAVKLFLVTKDAQILATDADGKTIARFKREHMAPGEMEQVALPPQLLKQARGPLTLSIREV